MDSKEKCAKCGSEKQHLEWCFDCKKYYCLNCVELIEGDEVYSNYVKYFVRCPIDQKHHMNSTWMGGDLE
ncbi:MAG: hypothetical protein ACFFDW_08015 [Candidatus Thorarchaeota archaeon]